MVMEKADAANVETAVLAVLSASGVSSTAAGRQAQNGRSQSLFRSSLGSRYWLISVSARPYSDTPASLPMVILLATPAAAQSPNEELVASTSCTTYLRLMAEDTQPGADAGIARRHVTTLMQVYAKYVLRGPDGKPIPTIFDFIISHSSHYCQAHASATVADAGEAVGIAERDVLATPPPK